MAWTEPIIDRAGITAFSVDDYARIKGNLQYLSELSGVTLEPMDVISYTDYPFARRLNIIERNIDILADAIYRPPGFPATKTWVPGSQVPHWTDANRWEQCCAVLHVIIIRRNVALFKLPFKMAGGRF